MWGESNQAEKNRTCKALRQAQAKEALLRERSPGVQKRTMMMPEETTECGGTG